MFQDESSNFKQSIILNNNKRVTIDLIWNVRSGKWLMYLAYDNKTANGLPLVLNYPIIYRHKWLVNDIGGEFFVFSKVPKITDITYDNLGTDLGLYFLTQAEFEQWSNENGVG